MLKNLVVPIKNGIGPTRTFENVTHIVYLPDFLHNIIYMYINETLAYNL